VQRIISAIGKRQAPRRCGTSAAQLKRRASPSHPRCVPAPTRWSNKSTFTRSLLHLLSKLRLMLRVQQTKIRCL